MFKQVGNDTDKLINKFGILNKSFANIKMDFQNGQGIRSLGNIVSKQDIANFEKFQKDLQNGISYHKAFNNNLANSHSYIQQQASSLRELITQRNLLNRQLRTGKITQEEYNTAITANQAQIQTLTNQTKSLTVAQRLATATSKALSIGLNLIGNIAIVAVVNLIITGITKLVNKEKELAETAKDSAESYKEQAKSLDELQKKYQEICDSESLEAEKVQQLNDLKKELINTYGFTEEALNNLNLEREKGIKLLENEIKLANQASRGEWLGNNKEAIDNANKKIKYQGVSSGSTDGIVKAMVLSNGHTNLDNISSDIKNMFEDISYEASGLLSNMSFKVAGDDMIEKYEQIQKIISELGNMTKRTDEEEYLLELLNKEASAMKKVLDVHRANYETNNQFTALNLFDNYELINSTTDVGKESYISWRDGLLKTANGDKLLEKELLSLAEQQFPDYAKYFENLNKAKIQFGATKPNSGFDALKKNFLESLSDEDLEVAIQIPDLFIDGIENATEKIENFKKVNNFDKSIKSLEELKEAYDGISDSADKFISNQKTLNSAFEEQEKYGQLASSTVSSLIESGYSRALSVDAETGAITLNKDAVEMLNNVKKQELKLSIMREKLSLQEKLRDESVEINSLTAEMAHATEERREEIRTLIAERMAQASLNDEAVELIKQYDAILGMIENPIEFDDGNKSTKDEEPTQVTKFKKALAEKQHLVAMKKLSEEEYLNWLDGAYKTAYAGLEGYDDDLYKYEEEIFSKRRELAEKTFDDTIDGIEKEIDALEKLKDNASLDADKIIDPKATEELKKFNEEMQKTFGLGNVDLTKRPKVDTETMRKAGYDTEDGEIATVYSSTEFIWQGDDKNGKYVAVHYTPILPDGTVLDDESLRKYLYETLESSQDILDTDKNNLGIVLKVDTDFNISDKDIQSLETDKPTQNIQDIIKACDDWDIALHEVQEQWMELDDKIANSNVTNGDNIYEIIDKQIGLYNNAIAEIDKRIAELEASGLVGIEDEIKELNKQKDDLLDKVYNLSKERTSIGVDNEIKYWEEMKSKQNDFYDKQIEKLKKQKKLLEDKNDEEERAKDLAEKQLELRKAEIALDDARRNRNVLVYTAGGGYSYEADQTAIAESEEDVKKAEEDLAKTEKDILKDNLDKQIDILEEQKDKDSEYYDTIIKLLEDMSGKNKVQSESNRSIWGELLATEAGQKALAQIDPDKLQELLDSGFLVKKDGKYSLGEKKPNDEKANEVFKAGTDVISMLSKLLHKPESEIKSNEKLMNAVSSGGFNSLTMPSQSTLSELTKTKGTMVTNYNNSKISNTYHVDKIDIGYSGDDFNDMLGQAFNAMNQGITINGNKVAYGN